MYISFLFGFLFCIEVDLYWIRHIVSAKLCLRSMNKTNDSPPPFPLFFCHSRRDSNAHCISLNSIFLVMMKILQRLFYFYQYSLQKEQTDYEYMRKLWKIVPACVVWPGLICDNTIIVSKKTYVSHIMYIYHIVSLALLLKYFFTWYLHGRLPHFLST